MTCSNRPTPRRSTHTPPRARPAAPRWRRRNACSGRLPRPPTPRPGTLQPGATNEFRVDTYNFQNQPAAADLAFRVKDQAEQVVFETSAKSAGTLSLKLPPDLPLTPRRELFLEVTAQGEAGPKAQV